MAAFRSVRVTDGTTKAGVTDLTNADGLNVVILDGSGDQITSFGGGTQYTFGTDTFTEATSIGTLAGAVRVDSAASLVNTDNEITALQVDSSGALRVTGGGGGTEYVVNAVVPADPTGTTVVMERDDQLSALSEAAGDWTNARATSQGELWVALADASGDPIRSFGGGTQYTFGTDTYTETTTIGTASAAVRNDALATLVNTDNELAPLQVDADGALWVHEKDNVVDSGNSSTATLANDATFTGTGVDLLGYGAVTIQIDSSHDSATNGMTFQFSTDNSNWDDVYTFTYTASEGARRFQFGSTAQYFRVVYTNGGTTQTHFRLQTILHHVLTPITSVHRVGDNTSPDRSSELVKSAIIAQAAGSGDFVPVQATAGGNFKVALEESDIAAANGVYVRLTDGTDTALVTGSGEVNVLETNSAAILADTANMDTNLGTVAGAVAAGQMQVDIVADGAGLALAANQLADGHNVTVDNTTGAPANVQIGDGTSQATVRNLAANDALNVAMVDGAGDQITSFGGGTQYAVNDALGAAPTGTLALARRDDTTSTLTPVEDDAIALRVNARGALWVDLETQLDSTNDSVTAVGDIAHDAADSGNPVKIGGKAYTTLPTAAATADRVDQTMTTQGGALVAGTDGTTPRNVAVNASGQLEVDIAAQQGASLNVTEASAAAILSDTAIMSGWDNAASDGATVSGDVAHNGVDAGEPVKVGMKTADIGATPTDVAAADRADWLAQRNGVPFVIGGAPNILNASINVTDADGAQTDTAIITVSAGTAIVVTMISATADNANTGDVQCRVGFGTTNTPAEDAAKQVLNHPGIAAGSGIVRGSGSGIVGMGASNEDLRLTCEDPAGGSLSVDVTYYTISI